MDPYGFSFITSEEVQQYMNRDRFRIGKTYISCTNIPDAKERIAEAVKEGMNTYICVSNPRTVTYATKHVDYREVMANSFMNLPDAEPMQWAAKLWGLKEVCFYKAPRILPICEPPSCLGRLWKRKRFQRRESCCR